MGKFCHFILTRFNIPLGGAYSNDKSGHAIDDSWLKDRVVLFEKYCFPSVCNQMSKNFYWFVFFDKASPQFLKDKITHWKQECIQFFPVYVNNYKDFMEYSYNEVIKDKDVDYVITTRLDNDDALLCNAVKEIQKCFIPQHNTIIDIEDGYCYDTTKNMLCLIKNNKSNQFCSLIERCDSIRSVFIHNHRNWIGNAEYITVNNPLWLEVVHERNLYNNVGGVALFYNPHGNNFNLKISFVNSLIYNIKNTCIDLGRHIKMLLKKKM